MQATKGNQQALTAKHRAVIWAMQQEHPSLENFAVLLAIAVSVDHNNVAHIPGGDLMRTTKLTKQQVKDEYADLKRRGLITNQYDLIDSQFGLVKTFSINAQLRIPQSFNE